MVTRYYIRNVILADSTSLIVKTETISLHVIEPHLVCTTTIRLGENKDCCTYASVRLKDTTRHRDDSLELLVIY